MKLQEVFAHLTNGELRQLALGTAVDGEIPEEKWPELVSHINLGLADLFTRFHLKEGRFSVTLSPSKRRYHLDSRYATSNTKSTATKFIDDSEDPFVDNLNKVERVYTDGGYELSVNDPTDSYSLMTPSMNVLEVPLEIVDSAPDLPDWLRTTKLDVAYRAAHPVIGRPGTSISLSTQVELPQSHLQALLYFVASRVNNPIGLVNEFNAGNNYAAKYAAECARLEQQNLRIDHISRNMRLARNGWV